jgi:hypothetical protein
LQNTWSFCNNTNRQINNVLKKEKKRVRPWGRKRRRKVVLLLPPHQKKKQALEEGIDHSLIWSM